MTPEQISKLEDAELKGLSKQEKDPLVLGPILLQLAYNSLRNDLDYCLECLIAAEKVVIEDQDPLSFGRIINTRGSYHLMKGELQESQKWYSKALEFRRTRKDQRGEASTLQNLAIVALSGGNIIQSLEYGQEALALRREVGDKKGTIDSLVQVASCLEDMGNLKRAINLMNQALTLADNLGDKVAKSMVLDTMATFYAGAKEYVKARKLIRQGREMIASDDFKALATNYVNEAHLLVKMEKWQESHKPNKMAFDFATRCNFPMVLITARCNFIMAYLHLGKLTNAKTGIEELKVFLSKYDNPRFNAESEAVEAQYEIKNGNHERGIELLRKIDRYYETIGESNLRSTVLKELRKALTQTENYKEAYGVFQKQTEIDNQRINLQNISEMKFAQAEFDSALAEQEAELYRLQKIEFQQKALRAQMNPHFIFNSLNAIQDYIAQEKTANAGQFLASFSRLMRSILENSDEDFLSIDEVVDFLGQYLKLERMRFHESFDYDIVLEDEVEGDIMQIPTMLIQPYVENAIVHGVNGLKQGKVNIHFSMKGEDLIRCTITDNGKGREETLQQKEDYAKAHKSMGTRITQERIANLGEEDRMRLNVQTTDLYDARGKACGTRVELEIPFRLKL